MVLFCKTAKEFEMKRHLATTESIAELKATRKKIIAKRHGSTAPENAGLTKEQTKQMLGGIARSGYKIPAKLIPKAPS